MFSFLSKKKNEDLEDDLGPSLLDLGEGDVVNSNSEEKIRFTGELATGKDYVTRSPPVPPHLDVEYSPGPSLGIVPNIDIVPLVFDLGSLLSRAGFGGDDAPRCISPSIYGRFKNPDLFEGVDDRSLLIGDEAQAKRGILKLTKPIQYGMIKDWGYIETYLHHVFENELRVSQEEHPLLMTETPLNPKENRERITKVMFEKFNVPSFHLISRACSSLYASGRTTGILAGVGHDISTCVPVYEGYSIQPSIYRQNFGGKDMTDYLVKILSERGYEMTTSAELEIVRDIKEKTCYVTNDYEGEFFKSKTSAHCEKEYELPDGSRMTIGFERFRAPEILFKPALAASELLGFHENVIKSIQNCDIDIRKDFYQNIVLWGGSTLFEGFVERMSEEVQYLGPKHARVKINAPAERAMSSWIGGSILTSLSSFLDKYITKEMYDEVGEGIVHRHCFQ